MPTIGIQPSLTSTKAIGAVLLHQFARDRFSQADIDQSLITKAEAEEHLDDLAASLLHDNKDSTQSEIINTTTNTSFNLSSGSVQEDVTKYNTFANSTNANSTINGTVYHSLNTGDDTLSPLDELQSLPTFASYGQELRKIAEEFERDRLRHLVKKRAEQVRPSLILLSSSPHPWSDVLIILFFNHRLNWKPSTRMISLHCLKIYSKTLSRVKK